MQFNSEEKKEQKCSIDPFIAKKCGRRALKIF
jgi:hypothetical protein